MRTYALIALTLPLAAAEPQAVRLKASNNRTRGVAMFDRNVTDAQLQAIIGLQP